MAYNTKAVPDSCGGIRGGQYKLRQIEKAIRPVVETLESRQLLSALPPFTVQAESFDAGGESVAYHDLDSRNYGGAYRTNEGVDVEYSADVGGGYDIGRMAKGEWLQYTINIEKAGTYRLDSRFYSASNGGSVHINVDGVNRTGAIAVPNRNTGWRNLASPTMNLTAGKHVLRFVVDSTGDRTYLGWLNWIQVRNIAPAAPSGLTATATSSNSVSLTWTDNASNETAYLLERRTDLGQFTVVATLAANSTSYADQNLAAGTNYSYRVVAAQGEITSDYSAIASATTPAAPTPTFTASWKNTAFGSQTSQFTAEFDATPLASNMDVVVGLADGPASSYSKLGTIVRFNNNGTIDARNGGSYAADAALSYAPGTNYHFKLVVDVASHTYDVYVTAGGATAQIAHGYAFRNEQATVTQLNDLASYNSSGDATVSSLAVGTAGPVTPTPAPTPTAPAAPSNLTATASGSSAISLSWRDNAADEAGYQVERKTGSGGTWALIASLGANAQSYSNTGLAASTQYFYRVRAVNGSLASAYSAEASATTAAASLPSTGAVLTPGAGFTAATSQPARVGPSGVLGYNDRVIARWDVVPHQTFTDKMNVGVVAFHNSGIDRVEFSVNGGAWVAVSSMTLNPQTGVEEYWATLDASKFSQDGQIEIRAIAYPKIGIPRVLQGADVSGNGSNPMFLNVNGKGTLPTLVRYVATNGSDTTGDGSASKPFATILRASRDIQDDSGIGSADGGTVYLMAGNYQLGPYSYSVQSNTSTRWLTIAAAPGVARNQVRIVGAATADGLRTKLVHFKDLTLYASSASTQKMLTNAPSLNGSFWLDNVDAIGPGQTVSQGWTYGWQASYLTDTNISHCRDGIAGDLVRNVKMSYIGSDAFSASYLVVNSSVENLDRLDTSFHPDVFQVYPSASNVIMYNVDATKNVEAQGLFVGAGCTLTDAAFINVAIDNQDTPTVFNVFQFLGTVTNMYIRDSVFTGPSRWRLDAGFTATDVVLEGVTFTTSNPGAAPGVYYF